MSLPPVGARQEQIQRQMNVSPWSLLWQKSTNSSPLGFILRSSEIPSREEKYDRRSEIRQRRRFVLFGPRRSLLLISACTTQV